VSRLVVCVLCFLTGNLDDQWCADWGCLCRVNFIGVRKETRDDALIDSPPIFCTHERRAHPVWWVPFANRIAFLFFFLCASNRVSCARPLTTKENTRTQGSTGEGAERRGSTCYFCHPRRCKPNPCWQLPPALNWFVFAATSSHFYWQALPVPRSMCSVFRGLGNELALLLVCRRLVRRENREIQVSIVWSRYRPSAMLFIRVFHERGHTFDELLRRSPTKLPCGLSRLWRCFIHTCVRGRYVCPETLLNEQDLATSRGNERLSKKKHKYTPYKWRGGSLQGDTWPTRSVNFAESPTGARKTRMPIPTGSMCRPTCWNFQHYIVIGLRSRRSYCVGPAPCPQSHGLLSLSSVAAVPLPSR